MATADIDIVCTDQHLADEIGGRDQLANLLETPADRKRIRERVLDDALFALKNRVPPIRESDLVDITELQRIVTFGALAALYRQNITIGNRDDVSANMESRYRAMYDSQLQALRPTVSGGAQAGPATVTLIRR